VELASHELFQALDFRSRQLPESPLFSQGMGALQHLDAVKRLFQNEQLIRVHSEQESTEGRSP